MGHCSLHGQQIHSCRPALNLQAILCLSKSSHSLKYIWIKEAARIIGIEIHGLQRVSSDETMVLLCSNQE